MSNRNPRNFETLKNNKKIFYVVGFIFGALIAFVAGLAGIGMSAGAEAGQSGKAIGGIILACIGIGGGIYMAILADNELTSRRNEIKCLGDNFLVYTNVKIPKKYTASDAEYDVEVDVSEYETGRKVQTKGYGGVFLTANTNVDSSGGNYDVIYIPGDAKAVVIDSTLTDAKIANRLYVMRKGVNRVEVRDKATKSPIPATSPRPQDVCPEPVIEM